MVEPLVLCEPLQPPLALQVVALVVLQVRVDDCPVVILDDEGLKEMVGAGVVVVVVVLDLEEDECDPPPPPPLLVVVVVHDRPESGENNAPGGQSVVVVQERPVSGEKSAPGGQSVVATVVVL